MFTLLALSVTLPFLQQTQHHKLTSSHLSVCRLLPLTLLSPPLCSVEAADGGLTFDFQHDYIHSSCHGACCLNVLFIEFNDSYTLLCYTCAVGKLCIWHTRWSLNYANVNISGNSIRTKETHWETEHMHSKTVTYWTTRKVHCCTERTHKTGPCNTNCTSVITESKHYNTISSFSKEQRRDSTMRSNTL